MPARLGGEANPEVQHKDGSAAGGDQGSPGADERQALNALNDITKRVDVLARVRVLLKSLDARRRAKCLKERHENGGR